MPVPLEVKSGDRYNKLVVIGEVPRKRKCYRRFLWRCDCGNEKEIDLSSVKRGGTKSCGCLNTKKVRNQKRGTESGSWKGGMRVEDGYVLIYRPDHPNAKSNGYIRAHTYVMSKVLGRPLEKGENVHHKDGNRLNNCFTNLELWSTSQPPGQRIEDKLKWAEEIIRKYKNYRNV